MIMISNLRQLAAQQAKSVTSVSKFSIQRHFSSKHLIINTVGSDRLGIVSDMTSFVIDAGGNVGESQAARLGSYFSLMMMVSVPESEVGVLTEKFKKMNDLNASVYEVKDGIETPFQPASEYSGRFKLEGADNPGIVHKVTSILSRNGLSIDKMETSDELAPQGSAVLFKMVGVVNAYQPLMAGFDIEKVKSELSDLGDGMNCDISMEDLAKH